MFAVSSHCRITLGILLLAILTGPLQALEEPDRSGLGQAEFRSALLNIADSYQQPAELPAEAYANAAADLDALGVRAESAFVDRRGGRWANLMLMEPLLPGTGKANGLSWADLGRSSPKNHSEFGNAATKAFRGYLERNSHPLRIDTDELGGPGKATMHQDGSIIQIYVPRVYEGVKVRGSYLTATINHGNLALFGAEKWGDISTSTEPGISEHDAWEVVQAYVEPHPIVGAWGKSELLLVPIAKGSDPTRVAVGKGYDYRLVWVIRPEFDGDLRRFEALVDAQTGEILSFEDTNHYAQATGGVYPVTNDGIVPDGVEQPAWPMPYAYVGGETTDTGGNFSSAGTVTTDFYGPYVNINDQCGSSSLTGSGVLDWGTSTGTDCATPGFGGAGNTHSSRTGFYELNKVIEMARGQLPSNSWLQSRLTSNMNINNTCNAYWNGTVNFYRSGRGCSNTGEIAGVFDHEWGHGMDANDATPGIASPSGEGIADVYAALRLNDSCIGRNFRSTNCSGFGDACLSCTGVRDIDYLKHASGQPHDYTWRNATCGSTVHCIGHVYSEAIWSLWKRKLQSAPYNYDDNTAHEIVNRLTFIAAGNTGTWFSGGPPYGGCGGSSGYMNYLAADDDNGNLNDGTPHMQAIFEAFDDQEIACQTPTVQDAGCAGVPTTAPSVTIIPVDTGASLSWSTVAGASSYEVFRTEGVFECAFGKVKLGETTATTWDDSGLQNGRDYSYVVIPKGSSDACFGPASACTVVTPAAGPNLSIDPDSVKLAFSTGDDGDEYVDNGEDATVTFDVKNTGLGSLTNVRISSVSVVSPAGTTITDIPADVTSSLAQGATVAKSFDLTAGGLEFGDTLVLEVTVASAEVSKAQTLTVEHAETDLQCLASKTWDFEDGLDGWQVVQGTFNQTTTGGGANGSSGYMASSANLDNQCDQVRSPAFMLTAGSTLTVESNFDIENFSGGSWWDRANVAVLEAGVRNAVDPDGGRLYEASGSGATCVTQGQDGWADANTSWAQSSWSANALGSGSRAGDVVQLDIAYGTDGAVVGRGFWFDQVTVTNIEQLVAQGQGGGCGEPQPAISLTKTGTLNDGGDGVANAGDTISYSFTVTNTGGVPLTGVTVSDPGIDVIGGPIDLPVGSSTSTAFTAEYTLTQTDVDAGTFTNTATATAAEQVSAEDSDTRTLARNPALTLAKTATQGTYATVGEVINYQFHLTNTGNTTLSAPFLVSDDLTADESCTGAPATLLPGDSTDCSATHTITQGDLDAGSVTNTASASARDPDGATVNSNPDSVVVTAPPTQVRVATVVTGTLNASKGSKYGIADVTVVDNFGDPVAGAVVTGDFGGSFSESGLVESTDAIGVAALQTAATLKGGVTVTFCVSDVSISDLEYVPDEATSCGASLTCGNGSVDTGEQCDGGNLNNQSCQSLGYQSGTLSCTSSCTFDTQLCDSPPPPSCGLSNDACAADSDCCSGKCRTNGAKANTCT